MFSEFLFKYNDVGLIYLHSFILTCNLFVSGMTFCNIVTNATCFYTYQSFCKFLLLLGLHAVVIVNIHIYGMLILLCKFNDSFISKVKISLKGVLLNHVYKKWYIFSQLHAAKRNTNC